MLARSPAAVRTRFLCGARSFCLTSADMDPFWDSPFVILSIKTVARADALLPVAWELLRDRHRRLIEIEQPRGRVQKITLETC